jgi:hypothetical protein
MHATAVDRILLDNIDKPNALFVFPTDIALSRWADRLLRLRGGGSLAMEQFTAWDRFKNASIRSRMQDKQSVPGILRKIFVSRLLEENAGAIREQGEAGAVFKFLIPPKYAQGAASFAPWLSSVLPQLGSWVERVSGKKAADINAEDAAGFERGEDDWGETIDLFSLTLRYKEFLETHNLFEPAWEKPPFEDNGKECFIFFPESLSDFSEYEALLEAADHVRILRLPDITPEEKQYRPFFYTNARSEITEAALYIRNLAEHENIPWEDIVVSIPDGGASGDAYEPYVLREFANRNIPAVRRAGKPLGSYPAGQLFTAMQDCYSQGFSFQQVSNLLLNSHLPWKNRDLIDQLIDFGIRNNCLCSWMENNRQQDVWLDAFNSLAGSRERRAKGYYEALKAAVEKICKAQSFAEILRFYFAFREQFLDITQCSVETDAVLSRCISELLSLTEIEASFPDLIAPDPYGFFIDHLKDTKYLPQENSSGVSILPYRTAAPAPFDCHIVLGASQDNLSMVFSRLAFLPRMKKERLGLSDIDASEAFIEFHKINSAVPAAFFCSRQSFTGFAIPHSSLGLDGEPQLRYAKSEGQFFAPDLFAAEERSLGTLHPQSGMELHQVQAQGFRSWMERRIEDIHSDTSAGLQDRRIAELIQQTYGTEKLRVSATAMEPYFRCSTEWLYRRVLKLESQRMETTLMAENVTGSLYHAILDRFFKALTRHGHALPPSPGSTPSDGGTSGLPPAYRTFLANAADELFDALPLLPGETVPLSSLTVRFLRAQKAAILRQLELLVTSLSRYFGGFKVTGSELSYRSEKQDYWLVGKIDLLLQTPDGAAAAGLIVDFKLNYLPDLKPCVGEGDRGLENFQIPMYITLAEASDNPPVHTALFFNILKTEPRVVIGRIRDAVSGKEKPWRSSSVISRTVPDDSGEHKFNTIMEEFTAKTEQYVRDIKSGNLSVFSTGETQCGACMYRRICRTLYTVDGERSLIVRSEAL